MPRKWRDYPVEPPAVRIGPLHIHPPLALAPMAGITSHPFRLLARRHGCGLVFSEMIHARALLHGGSYSRQLTFFEEAERPIGFQLVGSDPELLAAAARQAEALGADLIDLNLGCPSSRIVRNGEGGALMRRPQLCSDIFKAVAEAVSCPVTVKMRKGWDNQSVNVVEIARRAEEAGLAAVTVHGRTVAQGYGGKADWEIIAAVKEAVSIPVFGNGDVASADDAAAMLEQCRCDGVMIGRAALGNPWIFEQVRARLEGRPVPAPPALPERIKMALYHFHLLCRFKGEEAALPEMRRQAGWYLKGFPGAAQVRRSIAGAATAEELRRVLQKYMMEAKD
ncbi:MAG: tRNA dihydrouridine synthase DusB [Firmicutes bacterium]|nr:tRNA dihydrouridine synthase DusB [Bacillota bacterium]HPU02043.1 tRNA dihydrouridine synthase DusB [Bacillota bacterium]